MTLYQAIEASLYYPPLDNLSSFQRHRSVESMLAVAKDVTYEYNDLFEELPKLKERAKESPWMLRLDVTQMNLQVLDYLAKSKNKCLANMKYIFVTKSGQTTMCLVNTGFPQDRHVVSAVFDLDRVPQSTLGRIFKSIPNPVKDVEPFHVLFGLTMVWFGVSLYKLAMMK